MAWISIDLIPLKLFPRRMFADSRFWRWIFDGTAALSLALFHTGQKMPGDEWKETAGSTCWSIGFVHRRKNGCCGGCLWRIYLFLAIVLTLLPDIVFCETETADQTVKAVEALSTYCGETVSFLEIFEVFMATHCCRTFWELLKATVDRLFFVVNQNHGKLSL